MSDSESPSISAGGKMAKTGYYVQYVNRRLLEANIRKDPRWWLTRQGNGRDSRRLGRSGEVYGSGH